MFKIPRAGAAAEFSQSRSEMLVARRGGRGRRRQGGQSEYRQAVRSVLPLMLELAGYLKPDRQRGKDHSSRIHGILSQALLTLAVAAGAARMEQQRQLLEEFQLLLADLRHWAWVGQPDLPGLIIDFLEFLGAMYRGGDGEIGSSAWRVREKLRGFHLLSVTLKQQLAEAPPSEERRGEHEAAVTASVAKRSIVQEISTTQPEEEDFHWHRPEYLEELSSMEEELANARAALAKVLDEFSDTLQDLDRLKNSLRRRSQELAAAGFEVKAFSGYKGQTGGETTVHDHTGIDPEELDRGLRLDLLIKSFNDISVDFNVVYATLTALTGDIGGQLCKQQLTVRLLQDKLTGSRMTPMSAFSPVLSRTVREHARKLNKQIKLVIGGEDVYLDRFVWLKIIDPLLHILSNAVNHGIESSEKRMAAGKPMIGTIHVDAEQRSRSVILRIADDGGGIDLKRIREKISGGVVTDNPEPPGEKEQLEYLFSPSFSGRSEVDSRSGRVRGLAAVRGNIQEVGGAVRLFNTPGQGVFFEIEVPCTVSVNRVVMVAAAGRVFAIPLQDIKQIKRFGREELELQEGLLLRLGDDRIPVVNLGYCLQLEERASALPTGEEGLLAIIFQLGERQLAVSVAEVIDQRQIIVKSLGSHLIHVSGVSGATLTGHGVPIPILNLRELISRQETAMTRGAIPRFRQPLGAAVR